MTTAQRHQAAGSFGNEVPWLLEPYRAFHRSGWIIRVMLAERRRPTAARMGRASNPHFHQARSFFARFAIR